MDDATNYRPISVLPILSKVLECLIHNRVYAYVSEYEMLSDCQAGFKKRNSTGTCLVEFFNEIYTNMDEGRLTGVLFLDLCKIVDTVDHYTALCNSSEYNIILVW